MGLTCFCDVAGLSRLETLTDIPHKQSDSYPVDPMRCAGKSDQIRMVVHGFCAPKLFPCHEIFVPVSIYVHLKRMFQ
jgi:hypothetical protein